MCFKYTVIWCIRFPLWWRRCVSVQQLLNKSGWKYTAITNPSKFCLLVTHAWSHTLRIFCHTTPWNQSTTSLNSMSTCRIVAASWSTTTWVPKALLILKRKFAPPLRIGFLLGSPSVVFDTVYIGACSTSDCYLDSASGSFFFINSCPISLAYL